MRGLLSSLADDDYRRTMGALFADASIGGHVRHALDHVRALTTGAATGAVDYDRRARGTAIETDRCAAVSEINDLLSALGTLSGMPADRPLTVLVMPTREGRVVAVPSTLARELAFVLSHTIHHQSTLRSMALACGHPIPDGFGYAPATLAHLDRLACAP